MCSRAVTFFMVFTGSSLTFPLFFVDYGCDFWSVGYTKYENFLSIRFQIQY